MEKHTRKIPTAMKTYDCTGVFAVYLLAGSKLYAVCYIYFYESDENFITFAFIFGECEPYDKK